MGYRIDYPSVARFKRTATRHHLTLVLTVFLFAVLLFNTILREQRAMLLKMIFPGDVAVTMASLENMLTQLKAGAPFQDALLVFCQQVIGG